MIINEKIEIRVNPNSRVYYNSKGYKCGNGELIEVKTIDLPPGSNISVDVKCEVCGVENIVKYHKYLKNTKNYTIKYTCKSCSHFKVKKTKLEKYGDENYQNSEKMKKTKLEKYGDENYNNREKSKITSLINWGVENPSQSEVVKDIRKESNLRNLGVENPFQSDKIKNDIKLKNLDKWGVEYYLQTEDYRQKYKKFCESLGVDHYSQSEEFRIKFEKTCIEKWGFKTNLLNESIKEKISNTNLEKYGNSKPMKNKDVSLSTKKTLIENRQLYFDSLGYEFVDYCFDDRLYTLKNKNCGHLFKIDYDLFRSRIKYDNNSCLVCYPKSDLSSIKEKEITNWIKQMKINAEENNRTLIGKELDIYLPDYALAIEFNGLYWHSDKFKKKNYHSDKTKCCKKIGIDLIHIWEDDWLSKKDIIKSIIRNRLKLNKKIYARKCHIKIVENELCRIFLQDNHLEGYIESDVNIGLYYEEQLISLMTFRKKTKKIYELTQFCSKIDYIVIGGVSKLFKWFIKNNEVKQVISYSDLFKFQSGIYEMLGFKIIFDKLDYTLTDLIKRYERTENSQLKDIHKIWSIYLRKWVYELN